ncbi:MAG: ribonuclease P protein component, partial [Propionibacteriaceae bacterium]|nr:ribonuclease P protein component [Propionibacteriaceae bacterium]
MLPQRLRLRRSADFASVIHTGRKVRRPTLILYAMSAVSPRFGVIVGKRVGNAVTRNLVKRRLRHQAAVLLDETGPMDVVVRALPGAGGSGDRLRA